MSDLSRMLDDLYALPDTDDGFEPEVTKAPAWSSDEALDEVFSSWVPGPSTDATTTQRSLVAAADAEPVASVPAIDDWLQETAPEPAPVLTTVPDIEPAAEPAPTSVPRWVPSDDDILPRRRGRGRHGRHARR